MLPGYPACGALCASVAFSRNKTPKTKLCLRFIFEYFFKISWVFTLPLIIVFNNQPITSNLLQNINNQLKKSNRIVPSFTLKQLSCCQNILKTPFTSKPSLALNVRNISVSLVNYVVAVPFKNNCAIKTKTLTI